MRGIASEAASLRLLRNSRNCRMTAFEFLQYFGCNIFLQYFGFMLQKTSQNLQKQREVWNQQAVQLRNSLPQEILGVDTSHSLKRTFDRLILEKSDGRLLTTKDASAHRLLETGRILQKYVTLGLFHYLRSPTYRYFWLLSQSRSGRRWTFGLPQNRGSCNPDQETIWEREWGRGVYFWLEFFSGTERRSEARAGHKERGTEVLLLGFSYPNFKYQMCFGSLNTEGVSISSCLSPPL